MKSTVDLWQEWCDKARPSHLRVVCIETKITDNYSIDGEDRSCIVCKLDANRDREFDEKMRARLMLHLKIFNSYARLENMGVMKRLCPWTWKLDNDDEPEKPEINFQQANRRFV